MSNTRDFLSFYENLNFTNSIIVVYITLAHGLLVSLKLHTIIVNLHQEIFNTCTV